MKNHILCVSKQVAEFFHALVHKIKMQTIVFSCYLHWPFKHFTPSHKYLGRVSPGLSSVMFYPYLKAYLSHTFQGHSLCGTVI